MRKRLPNFLLALAIIGGSVLLITLGGKYYYRYRLGHISVYNVGGYEWEFLLPFILGSCLILPYIIYQFSKDSTKEFLKGEKLDLNRMGHTVESYFRFKAKKGLVEIYVQNQTGDTLIEIVCWDMGNGIFLRSRDENHCTLVMA